MQIRDMITNTNQPAVTKEGNILKQKKINISKICL